MRAAAFRIGPVDCHVARAVLDHWGSKAPRVSPIDETVGDVALNYHDVGSRSSYARKITGTPEWGSEPEVMGFTLRTGIPVTVRAHGFEQKYGRDADDRGEGCKIDLSNWNHFTGP